MCISDRLKVMKKKDKNAMDKAAFDFDFYIVLLMTLLKTHGVYA